MRKIELIRVCSDNTHGTFGTLLIDNIPVCVTLEETWLDNKKRESCIPAGKYEVRKYSGTKYKNVWQVYGVPDRSAILIHWGNTERNTAGCILVGKYFDKFGDRFGVAASKVTIDKLRQTLPDRFEIDIIDCFTKKQNNEETETCQQKQDIKQQSFGQWLQRLLQRF